MLPRLEIDPAEEFTGGEIRELTARVAASHRDTASGRALTDVVSAVTAVAITIGLVIGVSGVVRDLLLVAPDGPASPVLSLAMVRMLLLVAGAALAIGLAARLGPLAVSGAGLRWWLPMPVDRASLLSPRYLQVLVLWSLAGAVAVTGLTELTASTGVAVSGRGLATSATTGALCAVIVVATVGLIQRRRVVLAVTIVVSDLVFALTPVLGVAGIVAGIGVGEAGGTGSGDGTGSRDGVRDGVRDGAGAVTAAVTGAVTERKSESATVLGGASVSGGDAWWWSGGAPGWAVLALLVLRVGRWSLRVEVAPELGRARGGCVDPCDRGRRARGHLGRLARPA